MSNHLFNWKTRYHLELVGGASTESHAVVVNAPYPVTTSRGGFVRQHPLVKSGKSMGWPRLATDISDSGVTALSAAASYTFISVGMPPWRHLMSL